MDAQITGRLLNRYDLHERLGRGGMGDVYKGRDITLDRWVAVKVLHGHLAEQEGFRARFEREAKTAASISHPNLINVYDFGYDESHNVYFIVLEYLPSGTLQDHMTSLVDMPLATRLDTVQRSFLPVVEAVAYAHQQNMIHRDIKPANILFRENNSPVLADFGLARLISSANLTATGTTIGTPSYMSPEQGLGESGDNRSDIYSLGIILYELLAGMVPFTAETPIGVIMKHVNEPLPPIDHKVSGLSPDLSVIITRTLAKKPADRYQVAELLHSDLKAAIEGRTISSSDTMARSVAPSIKESASTSTATDEGTTIAFLRETAKKRPVLLWGSLAAVAAILIFAGLLNRLPSTAADTPTPEATVAEIDTSDDRGADSMAGEEADVPSMAGGPISMTDDFSAAGTGWEIQTDGSATYDYEDGLYRFTNLAPGQARWALFEPVYTYTDTYYSMDATLESGQVESGFGLVFRYQDEGHFYVFAIDGRGRYSIWALDDSGWRELRGLGETWTVSDAILVAGETNQLTVIAEEDHLIGMVNGVTVADVLDATYSGGAVGVYVATVPGDGPPAVVAFDNFVIEPAIPAMTAP